MIFSKIEHREIHNKIPKTTSSKTDFIDRMGFQKRTSKWIMCFVDCAVWVGVGVEGADMAMLWSVLKLDLQQMHRMCFEMEYQAA